MPKTMGHGAVRAGVSVFVLGLTAACTGVSSLPSGGTGAGMTGEQPGGTGHTGVPATGSNGTPGSGSGGTTATAIPGLSSWANISPTMTMDAGRVVLRRLNNAEYDNTMRDLLGTATRPSVDLMFSSDNVNMDGFDTVGSVLSYSNLLLEGQDAAADKLLAELMARPKTDPLRLRIMLCEPTAANIATCASQILKPFATSAYRRPVTDAEVADLVSLATSITTSSADPVNGMTSALKAVLMSPNFLFHMETSGAATSTAAAKLTDYELASRLSYFLWSTMPDAPLMTAAAAAKLTPLGADFTSQVARMIADPIKFQSFIDNYGGQALTLRDAKLVSPQADLFPTFDDPLHAAIVPETSNFFASLIRDAQPLTTLLLADFTFVNDRLAKQYGVPGGQTTFTKVTLPATSHRMGILTQESFLTVTSMPDRTSPVKRGNWVLDQILCDSAPPPPKDVKAFIAPTTASGLTVRQALAAHRASPSCAVCHNTIDPLGLAFENFDAMGSYRTTDNGAAVDASGTLPDGTTFTDAKGLATSLAADPRFIRCMVKQALTYAVGRSFDSRDARAYVAGLADPLAKANATWPDLLKTVASSEAFLTRRGEGP
jgi:hypothetical protein